MLGFLYFLCWVLGFVHLTVMGNWENRRIFRQRRIRRSPPRVYNHVPPPKWKDGVPLREKNFCSLVGTIHALLYVLAFYLKNDKVF